MSKQIASRVEILEFIRLEEFIQPWQLRDRFGYTEKSARRILYRLEDSGLVVNTLGYKNYPCKWTITEYGMRRLEYYVDKAEKSKTPTQGRGASTGATRT